jgi:CDP-diacylglycerol--glycerol-3-phosphate 3-phosphatidyltransferase
MNLPNKLTVSRLVMTAAFVVSMALGNEWEELHAPGRSAGWSFAYTAALLLFIAAGVTDYLDGYLARKHGSVTNFGKMMDPLADKVLISGAFICLVPLKAIPAWVAIVIISREFLITGLRLLAAGKGVVLQSDKLGKHKTVWQIVTTGYFLLLLALMEWEHAGWVSLHAADWSWPLWRYGGWTLAAVALVLTLYSGLGYVWKHREFFME